MGSDFSPDLKHLLRDLTSVCPAASAQHTTRNSGRVANLLADRLHDDHRPVPQMGGFLLLALCEVAN